MVRSEGVERITRVGQLDGVKNGVNLNQVLRINYQEFSVKEDISGKMIYNFYKIEIKVALKGQNS